MQRGFDWSCGRYCASRKSGLFTGRTIHPPPPPASVIQASTRADTPPPTPPPPLCGVKQRRKNYGPSRQSVLGGWPGVGRQQPAGRGGPPRGTAATDRPRGGRLEGAQQRPDGRLVHVGLLDDERHWEGMTEGKQGGREGGWVGVSMGGQRGGERGQGRSTIETIGTVSRAGQRVRGRHRQASQGPPPSCLCRPRSACPPSHLPKKKNKKKTYGC